MAATVTINAQLNTSQVESGAQQISNSLNGIGTSGQSAMSAIDVAIGGLISGAINSLINSLKGLVSSTLEVGMNFEDSMANVAAISGATGDELDKLTNKAKEMGATTKYTASEAADALSYMALAGWDADQSCDALGGVLNLAAASGMDLAEASDLVTDYITAFGLECSDAAYMADLMTAAQTNANTTAQQLGAAWGNCATYLSGAGQDVETVSAALMVMADSGLKGSEAGTALKAIMRDITNNMQDGAIAIGDVSVQVADADGNFRDLNDILADVEGAVDGLGTAEQTAALSTSFTSYSLTGLNAILGQGVDCIDEYEEVLRQSGGTAEEVAGIMQDTLSGDLTKMNSAFESVQQAVYEYFEPALRDVVEYVTGSIIPALQDFANNLDQWMPVIEAVVGALALIVGHGLWAFLSGTVVPLIAGLASPFLAAAAAVGVVVAIFTDLYNSSEPVREMVDEVMSGLGGLIDAFVELGETIVNLVMPYFQQLYDFFSEIFETIILVVGEFVSGVIEKFTDFISQVTEKFGEMEGAAAIFTSFLDLMQAAWDVFCEYLLPVIQNVLDAVSAYIGAILGVIEGVIDVFLGLVSGNWEQAWTGVQEIFSSIWDAICALVDGAIDYITGVFTAALDLFLSLFGTSLDEIADFWTDTWQSICDFVTSIFNAISKVISTVMNAIQVAIGTVLLVISSIWSGDWETVKQVASTIWNAISSLISSAINAVASTISSVVSSIKSVWSSGWETIKSTASSAWEMIKSSVSSAISSVVSTVQSLPSKITSVFSNAGTLLYSAGKNIIQGLINGITGMVSSLYSSIKSALSGLVDKAKSALGISSPSKVFRDEIGEFIPEGIAVGIEGNMDVPIDQLEELADLMAATTFDDVEVGVSTAAVQAGKYDYVDETETNVASVLDKLDDVIEALAGLANLGFEINLDGKQIAKGIAAESDRISGQRQSWAVRGLAV